MFIGKVISWRGLLLLFTLQVIPTRAWVGWRRRARDGIIVVESFILGVLLDFFFGVDGLMGRLGCDFVILYSHYVEVAFIAMDVHSLVVVVLY
jgi:hypothetical protein